MVGGFHQGDDAETQSDAEGADVEVFVEDERGPRGAGAFPRHLVPAARVGDYFRLLPADDVYEVRAVVPQPGVRAFNSNDDDDLTIDAGATDEDNEMTQLAMADNWLGQLRFVQPGVELPDGVEIRVDYGGRQAPFFTSKNSRSVIDNNTGTLAGYDEDDDAAVAFEHASALAEFYVFEDEVPYFTVENTSDGEVDVADLTFSGWQYQLSRDPVSLPDNTHPVTVPTERIRS